MQFTKEQFLDIFIKYNTSVFPVQIIIYILGLIAVYLSFRKSAVSDRIISSILTLFWLWIGVVYNFIFFTEINKAAYLFGSLFIIQSGLFLYTGIIKTVCSLNISQTYIPSQGLY